MSCKINAKKPERETSFRTPVGDWHFQRPDAIMKSQPQTNETFIGQLFCAAAVFATGDALGPHRRWRKGKKRKTVSATRADEVGPAAPDPVAEMEVGEKLCLSWNCRGKLQVGA